MVYGLDLWVLLVEYTFGSLWLAGLGVLALMVFIGIISRMSTTSIIVISFTFAGAYLVGYIGALAAVPLFILSLVYFISSIINYFTQVRT